MLHSLTLRLHFGEIPKKNSKVGSRQSAIGSQQLVDGSSLF